MPFADIIPVPVRNMHGDVPFNDGLATQPRRQLVVGGLFDAIHLVVIHLGQAAGSLLHHHVASRTGATSAAGVFQMEAKIHRYVEQRFRLPMSFIG